jgi:hypothetical protein
MLCSLWPAAVTALEGLHLLHARAARARARAAWPVAPVQRADAAPASAHRLNVHCVYTLRARCIAGHRQSPVAGPRTPAHV